MRKIIFGLGLAALGWTGTAVAAPLTECGQVINGTAELTEDLDCSGAADDAVYIRAGRLKLNGHTLTARVRCQNEDPENSFQPGGCSVAGPGTIRGCVHSFGRISVQGVTFDHGLASCPRALEAGGAALVRDSSFSDYPSMAVYAYSILLQDAHIENCGLTLDHVSLLSSKGGGSSGRIWIINSTISGSAGVIADRARVVVRDSSITDIEGYGVSSLGDRVVMTNSSITGASGVGLSGTTVRAVDSTITGSCHDPGFESCHDVLARKSFQNLRSTCDSSYCSDADAPCGGCTND